VTVGPLFEPRPGEPLGDRCARAASSIREAEVTLKAVVNLTEIANVLELAADALSLSFDDRQGRRRA
jgi:hypothetical protein